LKVSAISMVRNEADVVQLSVLHHLAIGCDNVLVADNGSSDGTVAILRRLARVYPVRWTRVDGPYRQSETMTELAREAAHDGADWIVPFDADEFWWPRGGSLRDALDQRPGDALRARVVNFVQQRSQHRSSPSAILRMTCRASPVGTVEAGRELVEAEEIGFVEIVYPPKHLARASPTLEIAVGNHGVSGLSGSVEETRDILCLHAPLRSKEGLIAKAAWASRARYQYPDPGTNWHIKRWGILAGEGRLHEEWAANSSLSGSLDLSGNRRPLVYDTTLRDAVARLMPRHKRLWSSAVSRFEP
jgi:hypothetical protein